MKFIAAAIFIILIMTQTFSKWIMIAEFNINRNYIAKNVCENRYRPMMHCNGHCQLMKKMRQEEQPANNRTPFVKEKSETPLFVKEIISRNILSRQKFDCTVHNQDFYFPNPYSPSVFRPPDV